MGAPLEQPLIFPAAQDTPHDATNPHPEPPPDLATKKGSRLPGSQQERWFGLGMMSLSLIIVMVFTAFPIVASFILAFFKWDAISSPKFVGLDNFTKLFGDHAVTHSLRVTVVLALLIVVLQLVLGLGLALLVTQRTSKIARGIFRTAFFLPLLASAAAISIVMTFMFDEHFA